MAQQAQPQARILLADDDATFRSTLKELLHAEGYRCDDVADGPSAIEALTITTYDLLIADIDMPGNRGLELVRTLVAMPERPPVMLITGSPSIETATKSVGLAVFAYLTKPFEVAELRELVREAVVNGRVRRAVRESEDRINAWSEDIARVRELLQRDPEAAGGAQSYLALTLGNLIAALGDFAEVAGVMSRSGAHRKRVETGAMVKALQETITVLEGTRHLFKSKELGALRKKLEELLR